MNSLQNQVVAHQQELIDKLKRQLHQHQQQQPNKQMLYRVTLRLPKFLPEKPALWFAQIETQFNLSGITNDLTKFNHAVSQLDHKYASEVEDIIVYPPTKDRYEKLKKELIRRVSKYRGKMLTDEREPSRFSNHLRTLADDETLPESFLRKLWANRPPAHDASFDDISMIYCHDRADSLAKRIDLLSIKVAAISQSAADQRSNKEKETSASPNKRAEDKLCWFHRRWGDKAKRCNQANCSAAKQEDSSRGNRLPN